MASKLRVFMQIYIFTRSIKETEFKYGLALPIKSSFYFYLVDYLQSIVIEDYK